VPALAAATADSRKRRDHAAMPNPSSINTQTPAFASDLQASAPDVRVSLTRAGVTGVRQVIRISHGTDDEALFYADIECSVDLGPGNKGVHMSRFPELFEEAIEGVVIGEALVVEELAEHIAQTIRDRQGALRSHVRIDARFPVPRTTPVTGLETQELYSLIGAASASETGTRRVVGVRMQGINACPCAQGMVRERAAERLADQGYAGAELERILDAVPIATHNQRGEATLMVGSRRYIPAERLLEVAERSMSAPIFAVLKRPDELYVVEQAHLHPRFVEDSVRCMIAGMLRAEPDLEDEAFLLARQVNFETIHSHDVIAERTGLVGEMRRELAGGDGGEHVTLDAWLADA
jgi:GTP cyclohydrolase I/GTP cyclohydrolase-4